jgi:hypothetical protein
MSDDKRPPRFHPSDAPITDSLNIGTAGPRLAIFHDQSARDVQ